jgi:hypothetical protein
MPDDLRRNVLISQSSAYQYRPDHHWSPEAWCKPKGATGPEWEHKEVRVPVLIDPKGPLSSPEQLRDILQMEKVPEAITVAKAKPGLFDDEPEIKIDDPAADTITVCHLSREQELALLERCQCRGADLSLVVWFQGTKRFFIMVESVEATKPTGSMSHENEPTTARE